MALMLVSLVSSFGQSTDPYYKALKEMFIASGVEETYRTAIIQMVDMYKTQMPDAPAG